MLGSTDCQSTPYHSQSDSTYDSDCYNYDALGRVTRIARTDGSAITTSYGVAASSLCGITAYPSLTTDEAGNEKQSWSDSFGRLVEVDEQDSGGSLSIGTCYQYDVLGNLKNVTQKGGTTNSALWRVRTYSYDGVSRMTSASNPESNITTYQYDADSNCTSQPSYPGELISQTDGRGIRTCMQYDAIGRLIGKTYTDGTPSVSYFYGQTSYNGLTISNGKGRRTGMSDGTGQTAWSYDEDGNVVTKRQTIGGVTNTISHLFNPDDSLQSLTSPNNHLYAYTYNHAGRPISLVDNAIGATYVENAHYFAPGQLQSANHGLNQVITETNNFNSRQQPTSISVSAPSQTLLSLSYNWVLPGNKNVGSVYQIQNNRDATNNRSFQYGYDQLNRLASAGTVPAATAPWSTIYSYDAWGNLYQKSTSGSGEPDITLTVDVHNHVNGQGGGYSYDLAGNLTFDGINQLTFDAENHLHPTGSVTYSYDGDGHRVQTVTGDGTTQFWYDDDGTVISTTGAWQRDYVYFNGRRLAYFAPSSGNQHYYWSDHLGSARVMSNSDGSSIEWEADYFPYGTRQVYNNFLDNFFLFTGDQFDYELGYNYAVAREQSPVLGRFLGPDQPFADQSPADPQTWNLYSYVRDNPLAFSDPNGEAVQICTPNENAGGGQNCTWVDDEDYKKARQGDNPGIDLPGGDHPNGNILCGENVCGSVRWQPGPVPGSGMDLGAMSPGSLGPLDFALFGLRKLIAGGTVSTTLESAAIPSAVRTGVSGMLIATENTLIRNGTKAAARVIVEGLAEGAQKASVKRMVAAAGNAARVTIEKLPSGSIRVMVYRAGIDGGQNFVKTVAADGTSTTVQVAIDSAGTLSHYDPK